MHEPNLGFISLSYTLMGRRVILGLGVKLTQESGDGIQVEIGNKS